MLFGSRPDNMRGTEIPLLLRYTEDVRRDRWRTSAGFFCIGRARAGYCGGYDAEPLHGTPEMALFEVEQLIHCVLDRDDLVLLAPSPTQAPVRCNHVCGGVWEGDAEGGEDVVKWIKCRCAPNNPISTHSLLQPAVVPSLQFRRHVRRASFAISSSSTSPLPPTAHGLLPLRHPRPY